ncbi:MAG TPA: TldD/PmbA family protein [Firmicutes bacterium]|jgi:TldD protein|nr:TldD/PmbA family protein [Bacillota bacterium]
MKVAMSPFLTSQAENLRRLVTELSREFPYVSVLGIDSLGKQYLVQKVSIYIGESRWTERGFVLRVYHDSLYSEFSFNEIPAQNLEDFIQEIRSRVQVPLKPGLQGIKVASYPLIEEEPVEKSFYGEVQKLPQQVSAEEKVTRMTALHQKGFALSKWLVDFRVRYEEVQVSKIFISTAKHLEQSYIWSQGYLIPIVRREGNTRYCYGSFSGLKGPELLDEMDSTLAKTVTQAEKLLDAKAVTPGEYDVICSPEVSGLIAHEAFGHGVELDMFIKNRAKAQDYLGKPVGSRFVTMHDGAAAAHQVSSYLFDDEGVLARDTVVLDQGILKAGISDQLSALRLGTESTGNGKRESFERKAYARMTNTFFSPGQDTLPEMVASIQHGYLLEGMMSGMEDPKNWGIQCMILQGEEIRDGKLTGNLVSPVIMTGYVPDVLSAVTMVSEKTELFGSGACGKGHKEFVKVSDGGPYIKTRVRLG